MDVLCHPAAAAVAEPHHHACLAASGDALGAICFRPAEKSSKMQVCGADSREFRSASGGADGETAPRGRGQTKGLTRDNTWH